MVAYTRYPWDPRVRREAETLVRLGRSVAVVCSRDEGERAAETVGGVTVRRVPLAIRRGGAFRYAYQYGLFFLLAWSALRTLRRRESLGAIHVHSLPDFLVFCALGGRLQGVPVVLDLHESMPEIFASRFPNRSGARLVKGLEKASCLVANRVLVVNETLREGLIAKGVAPDRVIVLYNSPDLESLAPPPIESPGGMTLRIVYAGGIDSDRDVVTLVRAAAALRRIGPVLLEVYGHGPSDYRQRVVALVDSLGVQDSVRIGGAIPRDAILQTVAGTTVGVATYTRNPITEVILPSKVFEYVALDKPLVLPDLRAMRQMFSGAALFYEPGNHTDLAAKIRIAAAGGPDVEAMRRRARDVYETVKWEVQEKSLAALYGPRETEARGGWNSPCT